MVKLPRLPCYRAAAWVGAGREKSCCLFSGYAVDPEAVT